MVLTKVLALVCCMNSWSNRGMVSQKMAVSLLSGVNLNLTINSEGVGMAHEIKSPQNPAFSSQAMMGQYL